jgi:tetratricopeptide (TPR) repeat protein
LGSTLGNLGKPEEAAEAFQQMLKIAEEIGSASGIGFGVTNMVTHVFSPQGEYETGLAFLETWLAKARQAQDEILAATVQLVRADLLSDLGQSELALEVAQSLLPDADRLLDHGSQWWLLAIVGFGQVELGHFRQARDSFQACLERAEQAGETADAVAMLLHLAYVAYRECDQAGFRAAMDKVQRRGVSLPPQHAYVHAMAARLYLALGDLEEALESSNNALQGMEVFGEGSWWVQDCYLQHARVLRALGRDAEADDYLQRAYERVMLVASKIQDETLRQGFLENRLDNREIVAEWEARHRP